MSDEVTSLVVDLLNERSRLSSSLSRVEEVVVQMSRFQGQEVWLDALRWATLGREYLYRCPDHGDMKLRGRRGDSIPCGKPILRLLETCSKRAAFVCEMPVAAPHVISIAVHGESARPETSHETRCSCGFTQGASSLRYAERLALGYVRDPNASVVFVHADGSPSEPCKFEPPPDVECPRCGTSRVLANLSCVDGIDVQVFVCRRCSSSAK